MQGTEAEDMIGRDRIDVPGVRVFVYGAMVLYGFFLRA